jgi:YbbR domain-containing protein
MSFRGYVLENFWLKLLALLVAVLIWWAVTRDPDAEIVFTVPIEFHHRPEHLVFSSETVPQAQVRLRGPARELRNLPQSEIQPIIDLQRVNPGVQTFSLDTSRIRVPRGVEVVQVIPSQLRLTFDVPARRQVKVEPRVVGTPAAGRSITAVLVEPATVWIDGPAHRVNAIENAVTDPVDANGIVDRATRLTSVAVADPLVRILHPGPVRVTVITEKSARAAHP